MFIIGVGWTVVTGLAITLAITGISGGALCLGFMSGFMAGCLLTEHFNKSTPPKDHPDE